MSDEQPDLSDDRYAEIGQKGRSQAAQLVREQRPRLWREPAAWICAVALVALAVTASVMVLVTLSTRHDNRTLHGQVGALAQQVQGLGGTPVTGASGQAGPKGDTGPGPSAAQVRYDIRIVCAQTPTLCQQPVSLAALVTAVQTCYHTNRCPAPKNGAPGRTGPSGASGQPGKDQPPLTQDQIVAGFAAYCGTQADKCRGSAGTDGQNGKDGTNGADGKDGADAPKITAIGCFGPLVAGTHFDFQFSNGVSIDVECTATDSPSDTPTPSGAPS